MCSYWATVGQRSAIWWEPASLWCSSMKRGYDEEHEAMWQGPAKCMKVEPFFFSFCLKKGKKKCRASQILRTLRIPRLHMLIFSLMLPVIAKHPPLISFRSVHSGVEGISCLHSHFLSDSLFSLSVWLRFIRFPPTRLPAPHPVGLSRQQAGGNHKGAESSRSSALSGRCESWGHKRTVTIHFLFSPLSLFFFYFDLSLFSSFLINAKIRQSLWWENVS